MKVKLDGKYKSLASFEWDNKSKLAIITGENGVGKTHLLELLRLGLGPNFPKDNIHRQNVIDPLTNEPSIHEFYLKVDGIEFNYHKYLNWNSHGKYISNFPINYRYYQEFINWIFVNAKPYSSDLAESLDINSGSEFVPRNSHSGSGFEQIINGNHLKDKIISSICEKTYLRKELLEMEHIVCYMPIDLIFSYVGFNSNDLIEYYVFFYFMQKLARENYKIETDSLGKDPIHILNLVLLSCGLKYEVLPFNFENYKKANGFESVLKTIQPFTLKIKKIGQETKINFSDLSSGERIILSLGFLEYYATRMNQSPSIMILDEIDAHLHPALIPNLYRVINDILIKEFNTKVIMTTHNPSTIALAPKNEDCIVYKMSNNGKTQLIKDTSKNHFESINLLTEGLVTVNEKTKYVFVEDEDDVEFYTNFNKVNNISNNLIFIPASNRTKKENGKTEVNQDGGKEAVNNLVKRFEALSGIFEGLIDKDSGNDKYTSDLKLINRYSLENYYFDPLVLFCFLNSFNTKTPEIISFDIIKGKEHELKSNKEKCIQIINYIISKIEPEVIKELNKSPTKYSKQLISIDECKKLVNIEFTDEVNYELPEWVLYYRGKNLNNIFSTIFGHKPNNEDLLRHFNTIGLYPIELINKLKELI